MSQATSRRRWRHIARHLQRVVPEGRAQVVAKLECENATGSMKDRMAQAAIARAEVMLMVNPDVHRSKAVER